MLHEDWEFFRSQRRLLEQQLCQQKVTDHRWVWTLYSLGLDVLCVIKLWNVDVCHCCVNEEYILQFFWSCSNIAAWVLMISLIQAPCERSHYLTVEAGFPHILESPWKYLNFFVLNSRPWKYLKAGQVLESPWIHQVKLRDISNFFKQH